jgi:hypothetical protein
VTGNRPDLWVSLDSRDVGIEITSRNMLRDLRNEPGGSIDYLRAEEDFRKLWNGPIASKKADYDGSFPIVLVFWDCEVFGDVYFFVTEEGLDGKERTFRDLLAIHRADCSPFSAIVYLPYVESPNVVICDGISSGKLLTSKEAAGIHRLFSVNPVTEQGFLPPGSLI